MVKYWQNNAAIWSHWRTKPVKMIQIEKAAIAKAFNRKSRPRYTFALIEDNKSFFVTLSHSIFEQIWSKSVTWGRNFTKVNIILIVAFYFLKKTIPGLFFVIIFCPFKRQWNFEGSEFHWNFCWPNCRYITQVGWPKFVLELCTCTSSPFLKPLMKKFLASMGSLPFRLVSCVALDWKTCKRKMLAYLRCCYFYCVRFPVEIKQFESERGASLGSFSASTEDASFKRPQKFGQNLGSWIIARKSSKKQGTMFEFDFLLRTGKFEFLFARSVTRFGEISPLGQNFKKIRQNFEGLFFVWQNFVPTLAIF